MLTKPLKDWFVVMNPMANGGAYLHKKGYIESILEEYGYSFTLAETALPRHAITLTEEAITHGHRKIMSIGGDGTLSEVVNGIMKQEICPPLDVELTHIPMGRVNDWAYGYDMPKDYKVWIKKMKDITPQKCDLGVVSDQGKEGVEKWYFAVVAGVALPALLSKIFNDSLLFTYTKRRLLRLILKLVSSIPKYDLELSFNEKTIRNRFSMISISLVQHLGGLQLSDIATPNQGMLTLVSDIGNVSLSQYFTFFPRIIKNTLYNSKYLQSENLTNITIQNFETKRPNYIHADGEYLGEGDSEYKIVSQAIRMRLPNMKKIKHISVTK